MGPAPAARDPGRGRGRVPRLAAHPAHSRRGREPEAALLRAGGEAVLAAADRLERPPASRRPRRAAGPLLQVPVAPRRDRRLVRGRGHRLRPGLGPRGALCRLRLREAGLARAGGAARRLPVRPAPRARARLFPEGPGRGARARSPHRGHLGLRPRHRPRLARPAGRARLPRAGADEDGGGDAARGPGRGPAALRPLPRGADRVPRLLVVRGLLGEGGARERSAPRAGRGGLRGLPPVRPGRHGHPLDRVRARGEPRRAARGLPGPDHPPGRPVLRERRRGDPPVRGRRPHRPQQRGRRGLGGGDVPRPRRGLLRMHAARPRGRQPGRGPGGRRAALLPAARLHARRTAPPRGTRRRHPLRGRQPEAGAGPRAPRVLRQAARRVAGGALSRPGRRVRRRGRPGPVRGAPLLPRPPARAAGRLRAPARRGVDRGLPRRAPPVDRRDRRAGRRRAAGGPAHRAPSRGASRALPAGAGLARGERARLRGGLRGRRVARAAAGLARAHRRRPAAGLPREALPRRLPRERGHRVGGSRDRVRGASRGAFAAARRAQGGPDRLGARAGEVRPRRRVDRHPALHPARGRPGREPGGGPQRPAADPGVLPANRGAPRARPLHRPRLHRDVHAVRGAARLPRPGLAVRPAQGGPVPHGPRRRPRRKPHPAAGPRRARVGPRDHAAVRGAEGLRPRHVLGPGRGDPGRPLALPRPAGRARRADPAGAAGGADAHHRRRLAGPDRGPRRRRQVRREPAGREAAPGDPPARPLPLPGPGPPRRASPSSTPGSRASRRTSCPRSWSR